MIYIKSQVHGHCYDIVNDKDVNQGLNFMPLSKAVKREKIHCRQIISEGYLREDKLWDVETRLLDSKTVATDSMQRGMIESHEYIHDLSIRLTLDSDLVVQDIEVSSDATPMIACKQSPDWYEALKGEKVKTGWRQKVKTLFKGVKGCTHLNDMLTIAATTAYQTIHPYLMQKGVDKYGKQQTFAHVTEIMKNSCHGFNEEHELIKNYLSADSDR